MLKIISLISLSLILSHCSFRHPQNRSYQERAREVLQKIEHPKNITIEHITGGASGTPVLKATANNKSYIIRFLDAQSSIKRRKEIICQQNASDYGYGPHVYIADSEKAIIVMDFIKSQALTVTDRENDSLYQELGLILHKLHNTPAINEYRDIFDRIYHDLNIIADRGYSPQTIISLDRFLQSALKQESQYPQTAPCHNDLNPGNVLYSNGRFYIIDYQDAFQGNPYFDVGTICAYFCLNDKHKDIVLKSYLGRNPSADERTRLNRMRHVAYVFIALQNLRKLPAEMLNKQVQKVNLYEFAQKIFAGVIDMEKPENILTLAQSMIDLVLESKA